MAHQPRALHVQADHGAKTLGRDVLGRGQELAAGVVHEHVDLPVTRRGRSRRERRPAPPRGCRTPVRLAAPVLAQRRGLLERLVAAPPHTITRAPQAASSIAVARPRPEPPPDTSATLPVSRSGAKSFDGIAAAAYRRPRAQDPSAVRLRVAGACMAAARQAEARDRQTREEPPADGDPADPRRPPAARTRSRRGRRAAAAASTPETTRRCAPRRPDRRAPLARQVGLAAPRARRACELSGLARPGPPALRPRAVPRRRGGAGCRRPDRARLGRRASPGPPASAGELTTRGSGSATAHV